MKVCLLSLQDGSTPLHYAAAFGQSSVIETLVNAGCPVDATDDAQNTPLHLAAGTSFFGSPCNIRASCLRHACPLHMEQHHKEWKTMELDCVNGVGCRVRVHRHCREAGVAGG